MNDNQKLLIQFALRFLKSNLDEGNIDNISSFWQGEDISVQKIEEQIDQCVNQFEDDDLFLVFGENIDEESKVSQRTMTKLEMSAFIDGIDEATPWLEVAKFPTKQEAEDYIKE
jgi:hypothetical protein